MSHPDFHDGTGFGHESHHEEFRHDTGLTSGIAGFPAHTPAEAPLFPGIADQGVPAAPGEGLGTGNVVGNPSEYDHYWFYQEHNGYCVPSSVTQVIEAQTGIDMHSYSLVEQEAARLGLPTGAQGLTLQQAQELLQGFSIPAQVHTYPLGGPAVQQLEQYLAEGRSVILAVNASPIWYGSETAGNPTGGPDHAVVVTAINAQTGMVTLSDPGTPGGNEELVPFQTFMEAWAPSSYGMLVTGDSAGGADQAAATAAVATAAVQDLGSAHGGQAAPQQELQQGPQLQPVRNVVDQSTSSLFAHAIEQHPVVVLLPIALGLGAIARSSAKNKSSGPGGKAR